MQKHLEICWTTYRNYVFEEQPRWLCISSVVIRDIYFTTVTLLWLEMMGQFRANADTE